MDKPSRTTRNRRLHRGRRTAITACGPPRGIYSATLTPLGNDYRPDAAIAVPYYRSLLERGCDGLNILGTTGEAMSIAVDDRLTFMDVLAEELPEQQLMAGTGASALHDAIALTKAAFEFGYHAALIIPPFYYREVPDAGIMRFFDALLKAVQPPEKGIVLYNFPRMSGITFHADLVDELLREFPGLISGMKDSSNDLALEREIHTRHPDFAILPGSEELLPAVIDDSFAGCISGSVCLWPELASEAWAERDPVKARKVRDQRLSLQPPLIPTIRSRIAKETNDERWLRSIPPL